jgi:membrane-associated protease RseP (regulator of RpoE activity)
MILLCSLIIIIISHEIGHLVAAKCSKCGVKVFSIGFGKPLFKFTWKKTTYQLAPLLLGGFCQLQDEMSYSRSKYAFTNKSYLQKVIISLAGIGVNCWSAVLAYYLFLYSWNPIFYIFGYYSMIIGLSNLLCIPALDGFYPFIFLFEKKWGKKRTYLFWGKICQKFFYWLMVLNIITIPYLGYLIWTGAIK